MSNQHKFKFLSALILTGLLASEISPSSAEPVAEQSQPQFYCGQSIDRDSQQAYPATRISNPSDRNLDRTLITWKLDLGNTTAQSRCEEASQKFQSAIESGKSMLTIGESSTTGQKIICAIGQNEQCDDLTMLFALDEEQKSDEHLLDRLVEMMGGVS